VVLETRGVKLKNALTTANRQGAPLALILGDGELEQGVVAVKDLAAGTQETWALDTVQERLADLRG
jgi:histidyl-tRNA synthetase